MQVKGEDIEQSFNDTTYDVATEARLSHGGKSIHVVYNDTNGGSCGKLSQLISNQVQLSHGHTQAFSFAC